MSEASRDPWFDNAKIAVLALVVAGHVIEAWIAASYSALLVYDAIYLFHMPAIILISGAFAGQANPKRALRQAARFFILYIVFQLAFGSLYQALSGRGVHPDLTLPAFALWFLPSMAAWSLLAPALRRYSWLLPVSVVLAIVVGYASAIGPAFTLSRFFVFLPYFALGAYLGSNGLARIRNVSRPLAVASFALALAGLFATVSPDFAAQALLERTSYAALGLMGPTAALLRLWILFLGLLAAISFLALVPARPLAVTSWGRRTLELYVLHSALIMSARLTGLLPTTPDAFAVITGFVLWFLSLWLFTRPRLASAFFPLFHAFQGRQRQKAESSRSHGTTL